VIVPLDGISFFLLIPIMHPDLYPRCVAEAPPGGPCWKVCKTVNVNPGLITPPQQEKVQKVQEIFNRFEVTNLPTSRPDNWTTIPWTQ